jgi:hypothetical protein
MKVTCPILIPNKKHTLLIQRYGIYGTRISAQISFAVINNVSKIIEIVDVEKISFDPKNENLMRELIYRGISRQIGD